MELFKNTNFDFLGKKWPFIIASLILTVAGLGSLAVKHGPKYGIDFRGGAEMRLKFNQDPPVQKIRSALKDKVTGEVEVQQITDAKNEVLVGVELQNQDESQLNKSRQLIADTLREMFGDPGGKLDFNNASGELLANRLRDPLLRAGVPLSEQELQDMVTAIKGYRDSHSGIINSFDELSSVKGVTPVVVQALKQECNIGPFAIRGAELVSAKIGADLRRQAIYVVLGALAAMLVYIWFRFEWIYGVAAVIAVFHDTIITIGLFSIFNKEISLTVIAALLTLVGYSMNDTIVTFDRIRENLKIVRREKFETIVNLSINQTLSRTILTSGLTLLTALSLWLFGGPVLNGFSFALVVGILVGTYSSIFIASPILIFWQNFADQRNRKGRPVAPAKESASVRPSGQRRAVH